MGGVSVPLFQVAHGYFVHIAITTPIASALKNFYRSPSGYFKPLPDQVAVSELKWPLRNRFGSETVINL
jgi:hypothetical protein